jgi:hypothetical protein
MCGLILVLAWFVVPRDKALMPGAQNDRRIDWVGGFLVTAAICLFTFSLTESGIAKKGWAAPRTLPQCVVSRVSTVSKARHTSGARYQ